MYKKILIVIYSVLIKRIWDIKSFIGLYFFFLSEDLRIKLIKTEKFSNFSNNYLKTFKLDNSLNNFAKKLLIKAFHPTLNLEYLAKFMFLIAPFVDKEKLIEKLKLKLSKSKIDFKKTQNLYPILITPLTHYGDYINANRLMLFIKELKDKSLNRPPGLYEETTYLTAIGHMCLFGYLLKAIQMDYLKTTNTNLSFVYNKKYVANNLFLEILLNKSKLLNLRVFSTTKEYSWISSDEHEIEVIPTKDNSNYVIARDLYGDIEKDWYNSGSKDFLDIPESYLDIGEEILSKNIELKNKWFVGMHLRRTRDKRGHRNSSIKNARIICESIYAQGGQVILVGTNQIKNLENIGNVFNTSYLDINRFERECVQLYVWSKARFFVGSISGGTHPPGLFDVPTIWLDVHPTAHIRFPIMRDIVLPCKIFSSNDFRELTFDEANSQQHCYSQSEMPAVTKRYGYKIFPADTKSVNKALEIMYYETNILKPNEKEFKIPNNEDVNKTLIGARYIFT